MVTWLGERTMETKQIKPKLIKMRVIARDQAYADLEIAPGFVIHNILYTTPFPGSEGKVIIPFYSAAVFHSKILGDDRLQRPAVKLPGWLSKWVAQEFHRMITDELEKRERKSELRRSRRENGDV